MVPFTARFLALAGSAVALALVSLSSPAVAKDKYACFTDDGYGRMLPCDFKLKTPKTSRN